MFRFRATASKHDWQEQFRTYLSGLLSVQYPSCVLISCSCLFVSVRVPSWIDLIVGPKQTIHEITRIAAEWSPLGLSER